MPVMAAPIAQSASRNGGTHANQRSHAQPSDKILVSWEEFQTFVEKALISVRAKNVEYDAGRNRVRYTLEGLPPGKDFSIVSIKNLYEKKKFLDAETCSKSILAHFEETNDFSRGKQSIFQKNGLPENLYPTVQTHDFILCYNEGNRDPVSGEFTDTLIFRPFSAGSGEIYVGLVLGMERGEELLDGWIPSGCLKSWKLTDDGAFDLAVKNLDRITPAKLICKSFSRASELERAIEYSTSNITLLHDMVGVKPLEGRGSLSVIFSDQRALPRLLLPRVVEKLAEVLRCDATSLVVVPFEDGTFHAACGEDCQSMFKLSRHQFAPDAQGDSQHSKHKVTHSPFRVRSLRNAKGLVELEPYLVDGGRVAVQILDGGKMKVFYPYARTTEELGFLEKTLSRPKKEKPIKVSTERAFLEGLCWQCREPCDHLKKCGNCKKARYCSRVCQKRAWAQGHSLNCEERRLYWERAKLRRPRTTKDDCV